MALGVRKRKDGTVEAGRWDPEASRVIAGDYPRQHRFSTRWVTQHLVEGLVSVTPERLTLHLTDGDVAYRINRHPGAYCTGCGERIGDGPARTPAAVAERDALVCEGAAPEVIDFYDTELEEAHDG